MARRSTTVVEEDDQIDRQREAEELVQLDKDEGGELFRVTDEMRGTQGVELMVVRVAPIDKEGYCGMMPVGEFTHDLLRSRYGAGKYKVRVKGPKGFLPGGGLIKIADNETPRHTNGNGDLASFLEVMDRREAERRKESSEKMNRLTELGIPALTTIVAALLSRNTQPDMVGLLAALKPAPGPSLNDIVQTLASMQQLNGGSQKTDPFDSILKMMEAVKNLSGEGGSPPGESKWVDVVRDIVREAVPAIKPVLENIAQQQAHAQAQLRQQPPLVIQRPVPPVAGIVTAPLMPVSPPHSVDAGSNSVGPVGEEDNMNFFVPIIREHLSKVLKWASDDRNPQAYAEVFMDELPSMIATYLKPTDALGYLNRPDWWERVIEFFPPLNNPTYHEWCDEFRQELIGLITEQMEESAPDDTRDMKFEKQNVPPQIIDGGSDEN